MTITNKVSSKSVMAGNTPIADVVDAPTIGTATAGLESATVTFTAAATGGAATSFGAVSTPGSITGTSATSPITISGLTGGTAYTFKTYGINSAGTWSAVQSASSNSVTPTTTAYVSIATVTASGGESSLNFTSIPGTYTHLQVRGMGRLSGTSEGYGFGYVHYNGGGQSTHSIAGRNTTVTTSNNTSGYHEIPSCMTPSNAPTGTFGVMIIDILDYSSTVKRKTIRAFSGYDTNGTAATYYYGVGLSSAVANGLGTSALTSIQITSGPFGETFAAGSTYSLYGIKGA